MVLIPLDALSRTAEALRPVCAVDSQLSGVLRDLFFLFILPSLRTSPSHLAAQSKRPFLLTVATWLLNPSSLTSRYAAASLLTGFGKDLV